MKYCKDCRNYTTSTSGYSPLCRRLLARIERCPIAGEPEVTYLHSCLYSRSQKIADRVISFFDNMERCGKEGRFFEVKSDPEKRSWKDANGREGKEIDDLSLDELNEELKAEGVDLEEMNKRMNGMIDKFNKKHNANLKKIGDRV